MDNSPSFHPLDYVSVLRRRMWWLIVPVVLAALVGGALATWLPRTYRSQATIGVSLPGVSINDAQRVSVEERARNISQTLLSPALIERVVRAEGLDRGADVADAVAQVRSRVSVNIPPADPTMPPGSIEQFNVLYTDRSPQAAQRVTNRLADVFVEETSRKREVRAEETASFIGRQLAESKARLDEFEGRIRVAKEAFMGALPEQTNANVALVTGLQQQLESTTNGIRGDQDRLSSVERQVEAMRAGTSSASVMAGVAATPSPTAIRVVELERELAAARTTYTDKHPEVVRLQEDLTKARAAARAESTRPEEDRMAALSVDPGYRGLIKERDDIRLRIADGQRRQAAIQAQIITYRARVDAAPRVEQQIATVQREYDLERQQYAGLTSRLRDAQMNESLARQQAGERFTVLTRAALPTLPFSPNTQRLMIVALLAGVCLGGGLALAREYLDRSIHDTRALTDLELPILGEIPRIPARA